MIKDSLEIDKQFHNQTDEIVKLNGNWSEVKEARD